jgi:chemotaxis protein CheC
MMSLRNPSAKAAIGRVRELAHIGAGRAAAAYATLVGRELRALEPRLRSASPADATEEALTGVIFEMEGTVKGLIALLLPRFARESLIEALCSEADAPREMADSALREVGNIVASQAVSAVADHLGGRITLSLPILVEEAAGSVFGRLLDQRHEGQSGIATESELRESTGGHRALLVFAPDAP